MDQLLIWLFLSVFVIIFIGLGVFYGEHFDQGGRNVRMETLLSCFRILRRRWETIVYLHYLIALRKEQDCSDLYEQISQHRHFIAQGLKAVLNKKCADCYETVCQEKLEVWQKWKNGENCFDEIKECQEKLEQCNRKTVVEVFGSYRRDITVDKFCQLDDLILKFYRQIYDNQEQQAYQTHLKALKKCEYLCDVVKNYLLSEYR